MKQEKYFSDLNSMLVKIRLVIVFLLLPMFIFSQAGMQVNTSSITAQQTQEIENAFGITALSLGVFDINKSALNAIVKNQSQNISFNLVIGSHAWDITVHEAPIMINEPVCNIYKGTLNNFSGYSEVYLHISDDYFYGTIQEGNKRFRITGLPESIEASIPEEFLVYEINKIPPVQSPVDCPIMIEMAVEIDLVLFNKIKQGLSANTSDEELYNYCSTRIEGVYSKVNNFLDNYFPGFEVQVVALLVQGLNTSHTYGWNPGNPSIATYWDRFQWCLSRDAVMLFTGYSVNYEGASTGGICKGDDPTGVDNASAPASKIRVLGNSLPAPNLLTGISATVAHELGHLLGNVHLNEGSSMTTDSCGVNGVWFCGPDLMCMSSSALTLENTTLSECSKPAIEAYQLIPCTGCTSDSHSAPTDFPCLPPNAFSIVIEVDDIHPTANCDRENIINYAVEVQWVGDVSTNGSLRFGSNLLYQELIEVDPAFNPIPVSVTALEYFEPDTAIEFQPAEIKTFYFKAKLLNAFSAPASGQFASIFFVENTTPISTEETSFEENTVVYPSIEFITADGNMQTPKLFSDLLVENPSNTSSTMGLWTPNQSCNSKAKEDIYVNNYLEIDLDNIQTNTYCFNTMTFKMANNAKILITGTGEVNFDNCKFVSCDEMWQSIEIGPDAKVSFNNCEIEYGEEAIKLLGGAEAEIINCKFRDNYISLSVEEGTTNNPTDVFSFYGNVFEKMEGLLVPHLGEKPYAGIVANDVINLDLGLVGKDPNIFRKMKNGILAYNTNLTIVNSQFKWIHAWDENAPLPQPPVHGTYAILAKTDPGMSRTFNIFGYGKDDIPVFEQCQSAITLERVFGGIQQCNMKSVVFGISARNNRFRALDVYNNHIEASGIGINLLHNTPTQGKITANTIDINDDLYNRDRAIGININEHTSTVSDYAFYKITQNEINLREGKAGIVLQAGKYTDIVENTINLLYDRKQTGIYTAASAKALFKCNTINGANGTAESKAIDVFTTYNSVIACNTTTDTYYGLTFNGPDDDIRVKGNNLNHHKIGLQIEATGAIGEQNHRGNRWYGPFDNFGARHLGGNDIVVEQSIFKVDPSESTSQNYNYLPLSVQSVGQWFVPDDVTSEEIFQCSISENNYCSESGDAWTTIPGDQSGGVVIGTPGEQTGGGIIVINLAFIDKSTLTPALAWDSQNHQFSLLQEMYPASTANMYGSLLGLNQEGTSEFFGVHNNTAQVIQADATTKANLDQNQIAVNESIKALKGNAMDIKNGVANAVTARQNILAQLATQTVAGDSYSNDIYTTINTGLPILRSDNQNINPVAIYTQNEQAVNDIYLQTVAEGSTDLPVTMQNDLFTIASQCPTVGGEAVFKARSLYALVDPLYKFDDELICQGVAPLAKKLEEEIVKQATFNLYPNPASDYLVVQLENIKEGNLEAYLMNSYGQIVRMEKFNAEDEHLLIETNTLNEGIYFCKLMLNGEHIGTKKLILLK